MWQWAGHSRRLPAQGKPGARRWRLVPMLLLTLALTACGSGAARGKLASGTATPSAAPSPTQPPCDPATQWSAPAGNISLDALSMVSADEGWATGVLNPSSVIGGTTSPAVLFHLVHDQWQRLPQTYPGAELQSLSMDSLTDGWAVSPSPVTGSAHPLALHYTGGVWRPVDVPALDAVLRPTATISGANIMRISVRMFGPQAGWMFAWTNRDAASEGEPSLVLRYEGGAWRLISNPRAAAGVTLFDLSAVSADEAWVVGTEYGSSASTPPTTLCFSYLDDAWSQSPETFPGATESLTMVSTTDGWAGDSVGTDSLLHYDGVRWSAVPTPPAMARQGASFLGPVITLAPSETWFVAGQTGLILPENESLWQSVSGHLTRVAWPFPDSMPTVLVASTPTDAWGIADIEHQMGCPPLMTTVIPQGVFLHEVNGVWTRQVLP